MAPTDVDPRQPERTDPGDEPGPATRAAMANPRSFGTLVAWAIVLLLRYVWPPADRFFQTLTDAEVGALMVGMLLVGIVVMALPVRSKGRPIEQWTATETDRREPPSTRP